MREKETRKERRRQRCSERDRLKRREEREQEGGREEGDMGVGRNRETQRRERDQEKKRERKERRQRELEERQRVKEGDRRRGDGRDGAGRGNRESREGPIGTRAAVPLTILPIRPPPSGPYALGLRSRHTREGLDRSLRAAQSRRLPARGGGRRTRWGGALKGTRRHTLHEEETQARRRHWKERADSVWQDRVPASAG